MENQYHAELLLLFRPELFLFAGIYLPSKKSCSIITVKVTAQNPCSKNHVQNEKIPIPPSYPKFPRPLLSHPIILLRSTTLFTFLQTIMVKLVTLYLLLPPKSDARVPQHKPRISNNILRDAAHWTPRGRVFAVL